MSPQVSASKPAQRALCRAARQGVGVLSRAARVLSHRARHALLSDRQRPVPQLRAPVLLHLRRAQPLHQPCFRQARCGGIAQGLAYHAAPAPEHRTSLCQSAGWPCCCQACCTAPRTCTLPHSCAPRQLYCCQARCMAARTCTLPRCCAPRHTVGAGSPLAPSWRPSAALCLLQTRVEGLLPVQLLLFSVALWMCLKKRASEASEGVLQGYSYALALLSNITSNHTVQLPGGFIGTKMSNKQSADVPSRSPTGLLEFLLTSSSGSSKQ